MTLLGLMASHWIWTTVAGVAAAIVILGLPSIRIIGPTEIGLVTKRFSFRKLPGENPIALRHEAGYQADLLCPVGMSNCGSSTLSRSIRGFRCGRARSA